MPHRGIVLLDPGAEVVVGHGVEAEAIEHLPRALDHESEPLLGLPAHALHFPALPAGFGVPQLPPDRGGQTHVEIETLPAQLEIEEHGVRFRVLHQKHAERPSGFGGDAVTEVPYRHER